MLDRDQLPPLRHGLAKGFQGACTIPFCHYCESRGAGAGCPPCAPAATRSAATLSPCPLAQHRGAVVDRARGYSSPGLLTTGPLRLRPVSPAGIATAPACGSSAARSVRESRPPAAST